MRRFRMAIGWLALAAVGVTSAPADEWQQADVAGWVSVLASPDASPEERAAALDGLRTASRGQPREELTREAILALANLLQEEDQARPEEALDLMRAAATYYPDDPRSANAMQRLARAQMASGDRLGAHFTLIRLFRRPDAPDDAELRVRAASNAVEVGEQDKALSWSRQVDPDSLPVELRREFWMSRLEAAGRLGRFGEAGEALAGLERVAPGATHREAGPSLTAARTDAARGRLESAVERYQTFVNVHTRHPERPAALLEQGQLLARLRRTPAALRSFDWILDEYPSSAQADPARLARIEADSALSPAERAAAYREVAQELTSTVHVSEACNRILQTRLAQGEPLEALSTLSWLAKHGGGLASIQARKHLAIGLEPALAMLADQSDSIGLAAAAVEAESLDIELPPHMEPLAEQARRRLGLPTAAGRELRAARAAASEGRWAEVAKTLADPPSPGGADAGVWSVARARLRAEADWRLGATGEAVRRLDALLASRPARIDARSLLVLRGDIRFADGARAAACADYREASSIAPSPWVTRQMTGCESPRELAGEARR